MIITKPDDLRYATDVERRYALAYLRWKAGRRDGRMPRATHHVYALDEQRGQQIRDNIDLMVRDAS